MIVSTSRFLLSVDRERDNTGSKLMLRVEADSSGKQRSVHLQQVHVFMWVVSSGFSTSTQMEMLPANRKLSVKMFGNHIQITTENSLSIYTSVVGLMLLNPLTTNDDKSCHPTLACMLLLVQSILKIGSALAERVG